MWKSASRLTGLSPLRLTTPVTTLDTFHLWKTKPINTTMHAPLPPKFGVSRDVPAVDWLWGRPS